ncbi:MAG: cation diffusion facilitator family transporter [Thermoanaerobaculia bacterium]
MAHTHPHIPARQAGFRRLAVVLGLVCVYMVAEVLGGLLTGSLALLADAGHMLSDAGSLALALFALWIAARPRTPERTYGYHRTEILVALVNGITLVAIAVWIVVQAMERLREPREVIPGPMMAVALGGLVVNVLGLWILAGSRGDSLNLRGAWQHVVSDALGSVQVLVAGGLIWAFGWQWADPLASLLIAGLIAWSAWPLLAESVHVLMEGTPRHLDAEDVAAALKAVEGVEDVHDLHLWTITTGFESLSAHARVTGRDRDAALGELRDVLRRRFGIHHSTIQLEGAEGCAPGACAEQDTRAGRRRTSGE